MSIAFVRGNCSGAGRPKIKRCIGGRFKAPGLLLILMVLMPGVLFAQEEVVDENCNLRRDVFDRSWKKYSDLDDGAPSESRSWEAQQHFKVLTQIVAARLEIYLLKRDMEIDRLMRLELRQYKENLVRNIKVNLLKSFWRLAYVTYDTLKSAISLGDSYRTLYQNVASIKKVGSVLNILKSMTPSSSRLSINTESTAGKISSVGVSGAAAILESLADPKSVGKTVFEEIVKQSLPSADLTPGEIDILRKQHLSNKQITATLEKSYKENRGRRMRVAELEQRIDDLEEELSDWEKREKQRVADALVDACKKRLAGDEGDEPEEVVVEYGELPEFLRGYKYCRFDLTVVGYDADSPREDQAGSGGFLFQGEIMGYRRNTIYAELRRGGEQISIEVALDADARFVTGFRCENSGRSGGMTYIYRAEGSGRIPLRKSDAANCHEAVVTGRQVCAVLKSYVKRDSFNDMARFSCDAYSGIKIELFTERKGGIETYRPRR